MDEPPRTRDPGRGGDPGRPRPRRTGAVAGAGALEGEPAVPLGRSERRRAKARKALGAPVVHEAIRREGEEELGRPLQAIGWSAVAAGLSMGFSFVGEAVLRSALPDVPWRPLVAKLGYSLGSVEVFYLVTAGRLGVGAALGGFVLPAFLGNSIGGVALVAALNHAQVVAGASRGA